MGRAERRARRGDCRADSGRPGPPDAAHCVVLARARPARALVRLAARGADWAEDGGHLLTRLSQGRINLIREAYV